MAYWDSIYTHCAYCGSRYFNGNSRHNCPAFPPMSRAEKIEYYQKVKSSNAEPCDAPFTHNQTTITVVYNGSEWVKQTTVSGY